MPDWLVPLIVAIGTICLGILTWSATRTGAMGQRLRALESRVGRLESTGAIRMDYIEALRKHINDGRDPPPPPYPKGIFLTENENE